jgi:hypothetical protein
VTGHSAVSYLNGTTDHYVGEVERDTYTARAEQMFVSRKAPTIGNQYKSLIKNQYHQTTMRTR